MPLSFVTNPIYINIIRRMKPQTLKNVTESPQWSGFVFGCETRVCKLCCFCFYLLPHSYPSAKIVSLADWSMKVQIQSEKTE